jgi:hypothetical protein
MMEGSNSKLQSTGRSIHWSTESSGLRVTKVISRHFAVTKSCFHLLSDHSPVLVTLTAHALSQEKQQSSYNRHTISDDFRLLANERLTSKVSLKTEEDIEAAANFFNDAIK